MRKSSKQIIAGAAAIALFALAAFTATPAAAAIGNGGYGGRGDGDATQAVPAQESCMQSPASTAYTPCWNNG